MALEAYQEEIDLNKVYKLTKKGGVSGSELLNPSLYINTGSVDVYGFNGVSAPTLYSQMTLNTENTAVIGNKVFDGLTIYMAVKQNSGTTTSLITTGFDVELVGTIT